MKDFSPHTLLAIAQETFGTWLWVGLLALAALVALYGFLVLARAPFRGAPRRGALALGVLAALAGVALAPWLTDAGHRHLVASIDLVAMALIAAGAFAGGFLVAWPILAALFGLPGERRRARLTAGTPRPSR
ncbi:DUF5368 family protein [Salinarimonas rosea]|uniref:DUF5368 family protein n=1 Tax=Salinarimonas rosea TaxID=552063 RepID=UPI00042603D1|nr:DUF5368 family protein [Salinarimonas rosea]